MANQLHNELLEMSLALRDCDLEQIREMLAGFEDEIKTMKESYKNEICVPELEGSGLKHDIDVLLNKLFGTEFFNDLEANLAEGETSPEYSLESEIHETTDEEDEEDEDESLEHDSCVIFDKLKITE